MNERKYKDSRRFKVDPHSGVVVEVFDDLSIDELQERFFNAVQREDYELAGALKREAKARNYNLKNS